MTVDAMHYIYRVRFAMLILIVLVAVAACAPTRKTVQDYDIVADLSGLELDKSYDPVLVYIRPGAPSFEAYNRFIIDHVQVNYTDPKMKELSPEQVGEMQQHFRSAIIKELREAGFEVGTRTQAKTMRISMTISGLKAPTAAPNISAAMVPFVVNVGEVTVEGVFREALTNRIDAVAVERSRGTRTLNPSPWST